MTTAEKSELSTLRREVKRPALNEKVLLHD